MTQTGRQDRVGFTSVLPVDVDGWPLPASPPLARVAVVVDEPTEPVPAVIRVKVPSDVKLSRTGTRKIVSTR